LSLKAQSKIVDINLAAFGESKSIYRGALVWDDPTFFVGPSFVFYKKLSLRGPSILYTSFDRKSPYILNYNFSFFNDRKPFITTSSRGEDFRNSRSSSMHMEIQSGYKFGFRNLFEVGAKVSYEFKEYEAWYLSPYLSLPVAPFVKLNLKIGIGEKESNRYLYGSTAKAGVGYVLMGLSGFVPLPVGKLIVSVDRISVEQRENRRADLVGGEPDNFNFAVRYFVKIY
jgi:hypothetical protein